MNGKEGRFLVAIGVGGVLLGLWFISQLEVRPSAWATHLAFTDTPPLPGQTGDCDEGFSAGIEFLYPDVTSADFSEPPKYLIAGDWNLVEPFEYTFAQRIPRGTITIESGLKDYLVTITEGTATCNLSFRIVGIEVGDGFIVEGPCSAEVGQSVSYSVKLVDGGVTEEPDDMKSPAGIVKDNGSEMRITRQDGNAFSITQEGESKGGILTGDVELGTPFEFLDEGIYLIELIWKEPPPPDAQGTPVEVGRAMYKWNVLVRAAGAPNRCHEQTIDDAWNVEKKVGSVRCDDGHPVVEVNDDNIEDQIAILANMLGLSFIPSQAFVDDIHECIENHEQNHVNYFNNPAFTPFDVCEGCGNCNVTAFDDADPDECGVLHGSEAVGHNVSSNCFKDKKSSYPPGSSERRILKKLERKHADDADDHLNKLLNCPTP